MKRLSSTVRITICLVCLTVSTLLLAGTLGIIPDTRLITMKSRARLCESIAINFSLLAGRDDTQAMEASLLAMAERNDDIESLAVRRASGEVLVEIGDHLPNWEVANNGRSTETHMYVPVMAGTEPWGSVEVRFTPLRAAGWIGWLQNPVFRLVGFMTLAGTVLFYVFLKRVLQQLNPSKAIPGRVRSALDTLAEGLLILDSEQRIVLANEAFGKTISRTPESLLGQGIAKLPWRRREGEDDETPQSAPWVTALNSGQEQTGILVDLQVSDEVRKTFVVNAAPINDDGGDCQGALVSLEDVTPLEQKKRELNFTLEKLRESSDEIRQQNSELERLATTDPLTECLNRRSFFEQFESTWKTAERHGHQLSLAMVDIDFFKSINDEFGHSTGDDVLRGIAEVLRTEARTGDLVCRFGGEEFCVLFPHTDIEAAQQAAERFRIAIEAKRFPQLSVTASLGVSAVALGAGNAQELLDQADKCLYVAKRNGRNQVVRWDDVPDDLEVDEAEVSRTKPVEEDSPTCESAIPYRAVTALLSTLSYRHVETAAHCRRVADLAVATAETLLPLRECYLIEIAGLLHDIGKVGVPDAILLKAGALTDEEWKVMKQQDRIGLEIIRASFASEPLSAIVDNRRAFYGGTPDHPGLPVREDIPLGARILSIADAFDSMTNDSVYRKAMTVETAFTELRDRAGTQFDPELVERFIRTTTMRSRTEERRLSVSKETALDIGTQIERLSAALDDQDMDGLSTLAERLSETATQTGVEEIARKADELRTSVSEEAELIGILQSTCELIDLCRSTQRAYIDDTGSSIRHEPVEA